MRRILLSLFIYLISHTVYSQQCNSLRYQDSIFHDVTVTAAKFGTAIPYGVLAQPQDLYLDFYEPTGDTLSKHPLIVFQFGGGFTIGWRNEPDIPDFCNYFAKCGYAVASIDYRIGLNPADTASTVRAFYRGVQDERSAIRYLCQRAAQFKIDTSLIILTGTSAGCFCAFANAFTSDADRPASTFGSALEPSDLGCMDCSGNTDLGFHIPHVKAIINQWGAIMDTSFIEPSENNPVISFHGDQDNLVPYNYGYPFNLPVFPPVYGSVPIHQRLTNLGILNELHPLFGFGHEPELLNPQLNDTIRNYSRIFLYNLLKPVTSEISGDTTVCTGIAAHYSVNSTPGSKYCWTLNGTGTIISDYGSSISVVWSDTGNFAITVKELNYILAEGEERSFYTRVVPHSISSFTSVANELKVSFTNLSSGATNFHWDFADGTFLDSVSPVKDYNSGGTYLITLIASNAFCSDTSSSFIVIDSCPVANITFQLNNRNAFFYTPNTNTVFYTWNFGDGDTVSVNFPNVFHQYTIDGEYTVSVLVKNQLGCEAMDTLTIAVQLGGISHLLGDRIYVIVNENGLKVYGLQPDRTYTVELFDVLGREVASGDLSFVNYEITIGNLPTAIYFLKISDREQVTVKKFIK